MNRVAVLISLVSIAYGASIPSGLAPIWDGRIVGGRDTAIEEVPWTVSIMAYGAHHCGGSIIKPDVILTATHCVYQAPAQIFSIRAGSSFRKDGGTVIDVADLVSHPDFTFYNYDSDIAIMWLKSSLEFSDSIQPIPLPEVGTPEPVGKKALIMGWGMTSSKGGQLPNVLQSVLVPVISNDQCHEYHGDYITENMICAVEELGGRDACRADSGGPFVVDDILYGVVSWGIDCALPQYPGVYASTSMLRPWIEEQLEAHV